MAIGSFGFIVLLALDLLVTRTKYKEQNLRCQN